MCPHCDPATYRDLFTPIAEPTLTMLKKSYEAGATPDIARLARPEVPAVAVERKPPMVTSVEILRWMPDTKELDLRVKFA